MTSEALRTKSTILAIPFDHTLLRAAKHRKTLQAVHLDLIILFSLVDSTLHSLDDALLPAASRVLTLLDVKDESNLG